LVVYPDAGPFKLFFKFEKGGRRRNVPLPMLRSNGETLEPLLSLLPLQLRQVENELLENYVSGKTILERTKK
ncbi:hypothetical protein POVCU2_0044380, partial [Plasmodium ovale curtisi]